MVLRVLSIQTSLSFTAIIEEGSDRSVTTIGVKSEPFSNDLHMVGYCVFEIQTKYLNEVKQNTSVL